jgi:hypothetical protein
MTEKVHMKIPTKTFARIFHAGYLNTPPVKGTRSSHEGLCLSVSMAPYAWMQIARLGEPPVWELTKPDNKFLNVHKISKKLEKEIENWGLTKGYITTGEAWVTEITQSDEDGEEEIRIAVDPSEEEAIRSWGDIGEEGVTARHTRQMPFPTKELEDYAGQRVCLLSAKDMLLMAYAELELGFDGVFWNENLDIYALSAPRAGIFQCRLKEWKIGEPTVHLRQFDGE